MIPRFAEGVKQSDLMKKAAINRAREIRKIDSPSARWIAADAPRESRREAVQNRLRQNPEFIREKRCVGSCRSPTLLIASVREPAEAWEALQTCAW